MFQNSHSAPSSDIASVENFLDKSSAKKSKKDTIIKAYANGSDDTGSVEVQCALLTYKIKELTEHCKFFKKDFSARRGLIAAVVQRKRLLRYLQRTAIDRYKNLIVRLELRK